MISISLTNSKIFRLKIDFKNFAWANPRKTTHETFTHGMIFWIFNKKDRYAKSFDRMQNAYETCGRDGSAGDFPGDKLFNFE